MLTSPYDAKELDVVTVSNKDLIKQEREGLHLIPSLLRACMRRFLFHFLSRRIPSNISRSIPRTLLGLPLQAAFVSTSPTSEAVNFNSGRSHTMNGHAGSSGASINGLGQAKKKHSKVVSDFEHEDISKGIG